MSSKTVKLPLLALGWILCAIVTASAQDTIKPEKRALIKELYVIAKVDKLTASMMDTMLAQMQNNLPQMLSQTMNDIPELKTKDRAEVQKMVAESATRVYARMREVFAERLNLAEITEQMFVPLYDKYFTEDDLKVMLAFYKSPTGQKVIDISPRLFQEATQRSSELLLPKLMPLIKEVLDEEKQRLQKGNSPRRN